MDRLLAEYSQFEASILRTSSAINREKLGKWLSRDSIARHGKSAKGEQFGAHGGSRRLLDFQASVVLATQSALESSRRCLMSMPTGGGKTYTALNLVLDTAAPGARILWLAPQRLLVEQAIAELRRIWWEHSRSSSLRLVSSVDDLHSVGLEIALVATTIQSVLNVAPRHDIDWLVVDEAHYIERNEFGAAVSRLCGDRTRLIGLSATPGRGREDELAWQMELFGNTLVTPAELGPDPVSALEARGVYAEVEHIKLENRNQSDLERATPFGRPKAADAACSSGRLDAVLGFVTSLSASDRCIIFGYSLAHCEVLAAALHCAGIEIEVVSSRKSESHNQEAIRRFRSGQLQCLVNVKYIATGADFPAANVAVLTVPVGSAIQFEQVVGRVTRGPAVGGTLRARVADFDNHFRMHSGLQSYARFSRSWKA